MAACRYVEEEGEISSEPSREEPLSSSSLPPSGESSSGQYNDQERNQQRKKPLHAEEAHRFGPPRARWKHRELGDDSLGHSERDVRWDDRQRDANRIKERSHDRRSRDYAGSEHEEARSPREDSPQTSRSLHTHQRRTEEGNYRRERDSSHYSYERRPESRSRSYCYRDDARDRRSGSRSSSVSRQRHASARGHSHSRSRSSSRSSSGREREFRPSDARSERRYNSIMSRFTPADETKKRTLEQLSCNSSEPRRSSPPLKKRWVPPSAAETVAPAENSNGMKQESVPNGDTQAIGKLSSGDVNDKNGTSCQKEKISQQGKKEWESPIRARFEPKAVKGSTESDRKSESPNAPRRKAPENKGMGIVAMLCMAAKTGSGGTSILNAETKRKKDQKETSKLSSPRGLSRMARADNDTIPKKSKESNPPSEVKDLPLETSISNGERDPLVSKIPLSSTVETSTEAANKYKVAESDREIKPEHSKGSCLPTEVKCVLLTTAAGVTKVDVEATPELTEVSLEDCQRESELKACSLALPAAHDVDPSAVVSESPYSLNHVMDEPTLDVCGSVNEPSQHNDAVIPATNDAGFSTSVYRTTARDVGRTTNVDNAGSTGQPEKNKGASKPENSSFLDSDTDSSDSDSSSEDEEEILRWAQKMFGITPPGLQKPAATSDSSVATSTSSLDEDSDDSDSSNTDSDSDLSSLSDRGTAVKRIPPRFQRKGGVANSVSRKSKGTSKSKKSAVKQKGCKGGRTKKASSAPRKNRADAKELEAARERKLEEERIAEEDAKRVKEEAKPPTAAEIKAILGDDDDFAPSTHWVRRSVRQPSKSILTAPKTRSLLEKLRCNDGDMVVLKMKKYLSDPATPSVVIDAALDALEENTNCEALYIQNFNIGMRDDQVLHLLKVLQRPSCRIWCLNIGETYNVKPKTWKKFTKGLKKTKVTHMYASEHTISTEQKDMIRDTIRNNRQKHDMHVNPDNLDVIIQCTHCWWNPVNAKVLRPFLKKRGYEHILFDKEKQGLRGSSSHAPTGKCDAKRLC